MRLGRQRRQRQGESTEREGAKQAHAGTPENDSAKYATVAGVSADGTRLGLAATVGGQLERACDRAASGGKRSRQPLTRADREGDMRLTLRITIAFGSRLRILLVDVPGR